MDVRCDAYANFAEALEEFRADFAGIHRWQHDFVAAFQNGYRTVVTDARNRGDGSCSACAKGFLEFAGLVGLENLFDGNMPLLNLDAHGVQELNQGLARRTMQNRS